MNKKLKVNVTFPLEVPVQIEKIVDKCGNSRRFVNVPNSVASYIDGFMHNMRVEMLSSGKGTDSPGPSEEDMKIYRMLEQVNTREYRRLKNEAAEKSVIAHDKKMDKECIELYGCSWVNFKTLSWEEKQQMRVDCGVVWKDGKWVKEK